MEEYENQIPLKVLEQYFPGLTLLQKQQFSSAGELYKTWNQKINLISRKDIDHLYERHILHSLAIAKFMTFNKGTFLLDAGTGGGFPGLPLAILFPEVNFHLVDSIGKKIKVVNAIAQELRLGNISTEQIRAEEIKRKFDFILSRAVAPLRTLYEWTKNSISNQSRNSKHNGWIFLKGGNLEAELSQMPMKPETISINHYFSEKYFEEKFIVYFSNKI
ncbi:MAG: 16S rRNA (guanine(527)-N(7))-methyltransferase RsmG [Chitinophagales bacterium]|nr:16S rRNA (guanine(527)-N(7))-methyltransferase RsmG [Chitinophagales bacterium]